MKYKNIILAFVLLTVFASGFIVLEFIDIPGPSVPKVVMGELDLKNYNFEKDGSLSVDGQWKFYWQQFLYQKDIQGKSSPKSFIYGKVPGNWTSYEVNGIKLPASGYGTFIVSVKNVKAGQLLALRIKPIASAYKIFIDSDLVAQAGRAGTDKNNSTAGFKPEIVKFNAPSGNFDIIIQVSNYDHSRAGIRLPIVLGNYDNILKSVWNNMLVEAMLLGIALIIIVYFTFIFFMQRSYRASIYIILFGLLVVIRIATSGEYILARIIPGTSFSLWLFLQYLIYAWIPLVCLGLLINIYSKHAYLKIYKFLVVASALFTILTLVLPSVIYTHFPVVFDFMNLFIIGYTFFLLIKAIHYKEKSAWLLFLVNLVLLFTSILDLYYDRTILMGKYSGLMPVGFIVVIIAQALVLGNYLSSLFTEKKLLLDKLINLEKLQEDLLAKDNLEKQYLGVKNIKFPNRGASKDGIEKNSHEPVAIKDSEPDRIFVTTFPSLVIMSGSRELNIKWRSLKVKELFCYLLTFSARPVYRDKLLGDLWPHLSYESAMGSLSSCLYQLRKNLQDISTDIEIFYANNAYSINFRSIISDSLVFENNINHISQKSLEEIGMVLSLYNGAYLAHEDYEWVIHEREWFSVNYIKAGKQCANNYLENKMADEAVILARRMLREQPFSEEIWEIIINAYRQKDDNGMVVKTYKEMERLFSEELGIKPNIKL